MMTQARLERRMAAVKQRHDLWALRAFATHNPLHEDDQWLRPFAY